MYIWLSQGFWQRLWSRRAPGGILGRDAGLAVSGALREGHRVTRAAPGQWVGELCSWGRGVCWLPRRPGEARGLWPASPQREQGLSCRGQGGLRLAARLSAGLVLEAALRRLRRDWTLPVTVTVTWGSPSPGPATRQASRRQWVWDVHSQSLASGQFAAEGAGAGVAAE